MHHRHPLRPSLALAVAIATAGALGLVAAQPAAASPTYHDQWPGKVVIDYKAPTGVITPNLQNLLAYDNAQPPPQPPPPLSSTFNKALAQNTPTICATIEQQFQQEANSSGDGPLSNWTCSLPDSGDLQATQLASNEVGLNYIVPGTTISFDANDLTTPTIHATFTLELSLAVTFAKQIGGYFEQPDPPITVASSELTIPYADVWSNDWFVPQSKIHHIWQALTSYSLSPALSVLNLGPAIDNLNSQLDDSGTPFSQAIQMDGSWCVPQVCPLPNGSAASTLFDLSVTVDADNLNLVFSHGALPPQPTGCAFGASSDSPPATIYAECSVNQPSGIQWLALRQEINGTWNILQEVGPGGIIGGPPLGPIMGAPQLGSASTVDVTVCSVNEWGFNCLPPTSFALQVNRVTHDAQTAKEQSGGYYGYGGGGAPPTPPAPACPGGTAAGCIRTKS